MIELPEAFVLSRQINETVSGKTIKNVIAAQSPHKFAWYSGDPNVAVQLSKKHIWVEAYITVANARKIF